MVTRRFIFQKKSDLYHDKFTSSLASVQRADHSAHNCEMNYWRHLIKIVINQQYQEFYSVLNWASATGLEVRRCEK